MIDLIDMQELIDSSFTALITTLNVETQKFAFQYKLQIKQLIYQYSNWSYSGSGKRLIRIAQLTTSGVKHASLFVPEVRIAFSHDNMEVTILNYYYLETVSVDEFDFGTQINRWSFFTNDDINITNTLNYIIQLNANSKTFRQRIERLS